MDMYGLGMSGIPPEMQAQYRSLQQQQMIANSLLAQSQDPIGNQAPGVAVSPFQGLAKVAQAYMGAKAMGRANDAYAGIGEKYQADQAAAIDKVKAAMAPTAATPIPMANANGVQGDMVERPLPERRAAVQDAMLSQFPNVRAFGTSVNSNMQQDQTNADNREFRTQTLADNREDRALQRDAAVEEKLRQEKVAETVREQQFQQNKELKEIVSKQGSNPFFQFLPGQDGYMVGNARTGQITPGMVNGAPAIKASDSPQLQGQIAGAKKGAQDKAEAQVKAEVGLPQAIATAGLASQQIDDLLAHPGFSSAVGATLKPGARLVDGTPEADFNKRLDQLKGGAFLQAFESLKGGGQITEVEGKKATEAITRMDKAQSEKEFASAAREFQGYLQKGVERSKLKAGVGSAPAGFDEGKEARYQAYKKSKGL